MENERLQAGQDIHIKWTATSGNVSSRDRWHRLCRDKKLTYAGLVVYLQRLKGDVACREEQEVELGNDSLEHMQLVLD
jgi:hypothetical protein